MLVFIRTLTSCPLGPLPFGGVSDGVAHCVSIAVFEQAERIVSATITELNLVSVFIVLSVCVNKPFCSRLTLREEGQVELWEWPNGLSAGVILLPSQRQCQ